MLDEGVYTQEEFEKQKQEIMQVHTPAQETECDTSEPSKNTEETNTVKESDENDNKKEEEKDEGFFKKLFSKDTKEPSEEVDAPSTQEELLPDISQNTGTTTANLQHNGNYTLEELQRIQESERYKNGQQNFIESVQKEKLTYHRLWKFLTTPIVHGGAQLQRSKWYWVHKLIVLLQFIGILSPFWIIMWEIIYFYIVN